MPTPKKAAEQTKIVFHKFQSVMQIAVLVPPLLLAGCSDYIKQATIPICFDLLSPQDKTSPELMINKCTGESWALIRLQEELKKGQVTPDYSYTWMKVNRLDYVANSVSGR